MSRWNDFVSDDSQQMRQSIQWENLFERLQGLTKYTIEEDCLVQAMDPIISDLSKLLLYQHEDPGPSIMKKIIQMILLPPFLLHEGTLLLIANLWSKKRSMTLTSHQQNLCLEHLCRLPRSDIATQSISVFVIHFHNQLPAEKIARDIIEPIFLHNLETSTSESQREMLYHTLTILLQHDHYASALLAPLTTHVDDQGYESTTPNPLGIRHLSLLESQLPTSQNCMTATMHAIRRVQSQSTLCPNMVTLEKSLILSLSNNTCNNNNSTNNNNHHTRDTALTLLLAVLQTYPILAATRLRSLLLGKQAILVQQIHHHAIAVHCCTQMIHTMPRQEWMNSYFSQRLNNAFLELLQVLLTMKNLPLHLCTAVLTKVPFVHDPAQPLTAAALDILDNITVMDASHDTVACIIQCIGGKLLPNGERTKMAIPMAVYLKQTRATPFLQSLWADLTIDNDTRRANAVKILGARWTVDMDSLYLNPETWKRFQRVMEANLTNDNQGKRRDAFLLLGTVLAARKAAYTILVAADASIVSFVFHLLLDCVISNQTNPSTILLPTCEIYSSMATVDWEFLFLNDHGWFHARFILDMCHHGNAPVRAAACKAFGEVCTTYLSITSTFQQQLCLELVATMSESLDDIHANVRSMATFCVGNFALAMRGQSCSFDLIPLCEKVVHLLNDSNGKVVNNAIRAAGHLGFLGLHQQLLYRPFNDDYNWSRLYRELVTAINLKIALAVDSSGAQRSWKERSNAKKHAWGACHALGSLLQGSETICHANINTSRASLELLIRCLDGTSSETEKILTASSNAILHIPIPSLQIISHRRGLLGLAMFKCTNTLLEAKASFLPYQQKRMSVTADLLNHLLKAMSILDATSLSRIASTGLLEFLYDWMVEHKVSADAFESLALAFDTSSGSVSLQQRFASRAMQRQRREIENGIEEVVFGMEPVDDSDEDEL